MSITRRTILGIPLGDAPWLVYLGFLAFQPLFDPDASGQDWALTLLAIVIFLPIYGWTHRVLPRRQFIWRDGAPGGVIGIYAIAALGILFTLFNSRASVFVIYAAAAAGKLRPRRKAYVALGVVMVTLVIAFFVSPVPMIYRFAVFTPAAVLAPIIGLSTVFQYDRRETNAKLRMAQEQVEHLATIAERERIARDLHDLLGHSLSIITLKSELAARLVAQDPARAGREMRDVEKLSRETLSEVRAAVRGYRHSGLDGELANAKTALEAAGIKFDYYTPPLALKPEVEGVLAAALREAVTNVIRHANASNCQVTLVAEGALVILSVNDDGSGASAAVPGTGIGAMRERMRALGGEVALTASPNGVSGTSLQLSLPRGSAIIADEAGAERAAAPRLAPL